MVFKGAVDFEHTVDHFNMMVEEFLAVGTDLQEKVINTTMVGKWTKPLTGWLKANVDAAYVGGKASLAVVLRNEEGDIIRILSAMDSALSAREAETKALRWASDIAVREEWKQVQWVSDALNVVKEINSSHAPEGWNTRYDMIKIKDNFKRQDWKLEWTCREENCAADAIAKVSFKFNCCLDLNGSNLDTLPTDFFSLIEKEKGGGVFGCFPPQ